MTVFATNLRADALMQEQMAAQVDDERRAIEERGKAAKGDERELLRRLAILAARKAAHYRDTAAALIRISRGEEP